MLHGVLLDAAERRLRLRSGAARRAFGMPLLQLERLTFRFVEAGFAVLTATLVLGVVTATQWRWDHKIVFSLLGWAVFAALLARAPAARLARPRAPRAGCTRGPCCCCWPMPARASSSKCCSAGRRCERGMKYLLVIAVVGVVLWLMFGRQSGRGQAKPNGPPKTEHASCRCRWWPARTAA